MNVLVCVVAGTWMSNCSSQLATELGELKNRKITEREKIKRVIRSQMGRLSNDCCCCCCEGGCSDGRERLDGRPINKAGCCYHQQPCASRQGWEGKREKR